MFAPNKPTSSRICNGDVPKTPGYPNKPEVFMGGLHPSLTSDDLKCELSQFGEVASVRILCYKDGRPRGFGFVTFSADNVANEIVQSKFVTLSCCTVECKFAISKLESKQLSEQSILRKIQVEGLPGLSEGTLQDYFEQFGSVSKVRFSTIRSKTNQAQKDYTKAIITFKEEISVRLCLAYGTLHQIMGSEVALSNFEEACKIFKLPPTQLHSGRGTNRSARSANKMCLTECAGSQIIEGLSEYKSSSISAGLRMAIRSAQTYENTTADNIEFRLNTQPSRISVLGNTSTRVFMLRHRLYQNAKACGRK